MQKLKSDLSRFKGIVKGTKPLTKKERQKLFEEFFKKDTSTIFKELGLD